MDKSIPVCSYKCGRLKVISEVEDFLSGLHLTLVMIRLVAKGFVGWGAVQYKNRKGSL